MRKVAEEVPVALIDLDPETRVFVPQSSGRGLKIPPRISSRSTSLPP